MLIIFKFLDTSKCVINRLWPILLCLSLLTACESSSKPELHLLTWSGYLKSDVVDAFEKKYDCRIVIDTYDSNESMYAKLKLGGGGYDIIFPSNYFLELMNEQGMLQAIDYSKIPNRDNIDPKYMDKVGKELVALGIPYMATSAGIAYRIDKLRTAVESWGIFGHSNYHGRMTMLNDMRETIAAALFFLGYSANSTQAEEINAAADLLIQWKKNLAKFENEQYKPGIASAEYLIVHGYNGDILQVMKENPNINFVYPIEGMTLTIDFMAIPASSSDSELKYLFINYLLEPDISLIHMEYSSFFSPNRAAYPLLSEDLRNNPVFFMPEHTLDKAELIRYLGESGRLYHLAWDRVKNE